MGQESVDSDIGDERRRVPVTTEKPYSGIAHLKHENGKGTGFLVKHGGRIFLVTAAHCLWDRRKGAFKDEIDIILGRDGEYHPFRRIRKKAVDFEVPQEYKETEDPMYAYGIILLDKEEHKLDKCCAFDLEPRTDEDIESQDLYMSGYPGIPEERKDGVPGWPPGTQWEIQLTTVTVNERSLQYRDATTPGNSGSPVYEMKDGRYVVHGIHTSGIDKNQTSNEAVRIVVDALMELVKPTSHGTRSNEAVWIHVGALMVVVGPPSYCTRSNEAVWIHVGALMVVVGPPSYCTRPQDGNEPAKLSWFQYLLKAVTPYSNIEFCYLRDIRCG